METDAPPSGIAVRWRHERLDAVLGLALWAKVGVGLAWLAVSALLWTDRLAPRWLDWRLTGGVSLPLVAGGWLVFTAFMWLVLRSRTEITITRRELTASYLPWHLPLAIRVPLAQIRDAEIETHCTRDRYGNEHHTFEVLLARVDSPDHPTVLRTDREDVAVYLRRLLNCYLENARSVRGA